jgi:galactose-1-phosphate uridylyltransferase
LDYHFYYHTMADGTVKQVNPFTGVEVWSVAGRGNKPLSDTLRNPDAPPIERQEPEAYCAFCRGRYFETSPEKARVIADGDGYKTLHRVLPDEYYSTLPIFRRISNLFEILSLDYWRRNYNYKLSARNLRWKEEYLSSAVGLKHVMDLIDYKLRATGKSDEEIAAVTAEEKFLLADAFYGGGHEMIIVTPHYVSGTERPDVLFSTAALTDAEHSQYYAFIIDAMTDIAFNNRYVRSISVFKNWLRPAGATFDHLHTQIVAIDEWGESMERQVKMVVQDKNVYNTYGPNFAGHNNLVFAENDYALAFVGIGHRYPTVEVFSKSVNARPSDHTELEVRGMSDLVRAVHAAIGGEISVNEEWHHTPMDSVFKIPWHVFLKLRVNTPAGFEGGTNIFINPITPVGLRDKLVPRLYALREGGIIATTIRIAEECKLPPNPLQYYKTT